MVSNFPDFSALPVAAGGRGRPPARDSGNPLRSVWSHLHGLLEAIEVGRMAPEAPAGDGPGSSSGNRKIFRKPPP